jgi:hypothetical protein
MNFGFSPKILPQAEGIIFFNEFGDRTFWIVMVPKYACVDRTDIHTGRCGFPVYSWYKTLFQSTIDPMIAEGAFFDHTP